MLRYATGLSCCLRLATGSRLEIGCSFSKTDRSWSTSLLAGERNDEALRTPLRCKSSTIRIANRKKVEMFVGKRYHLPTRLRTAAPETAMEWDYENNPMHLYPEIVSIGYMHPVAWKCSTCDHSYKMSVEKRVVRGGGCPMCAERELNRSMAHNAAAMERGFATDVGTMEKPRLLPGEENRALRPKRTTMLNIRTKY